MPILETEDLTHIFPEGTVAIQDISLKINEGEFVVIAGANGSGKTVFARHLNGLLKPTKGRVLLDGEPITKNIVEARRKVGLVFQDPDSQFVGQTVAEDVAFGPENLNLPVKEVETIVKESLEAVGLSGFSSRSPHALSGGEKRKLAIAGILAMKPKIIIFDEPFTGLDYPGVVQVLKQIVQLHKKGHTILLITHELEKVLAHANRLVIMHKGKLVEDGKPEDVIYRSENYGVRMPLNDGQKVAALTWLK
ncbi:MAG: energy-coupling factor ABC transporter ATP-binding protein [Thermacetogeniaceae bacterium]|jgi:biotin transport system ATP-binding protein|nr:ATP-binding cassette domain-containing protein [Thermoanaerobacterales bacterium]NLN21529.1 ATP-binding cassette domain-containing protein [Syntrophomonadaceae bacterium]